MKLKVENTRRILLEMNEKEAQWLREISDCISNTSDEEVVTFLRELKDELSINNIFMMDGIERRIIKHGRNSSRIVLQRQKAVEEGDDDNA